MKKIYNKNLYQNFKSDYSPDDFHHIAFKTTNYKKWLISIRICLDVSLYIKAT